MKLITDVSLQEILTYVYKEYAKKNELTTGLAAKADKNHGHTAADVGARPSTWVPAWGDVTGKPSSFTPTLGTTSATAFRGDYGNIAYNHSQAAHAPSNAQKNSDITKAEIETKLTGDITTHTHDGRYYTESEVNNLLSGKASNSHTHNYAGSSSAGGSANSAIKLATARSLSIGSVAKNFDGTGNVSWSLSEIGASKGKDVSATTPATAGWYRIAQTSSIDQGNNIAIFQIQGVVSSHHTSAIIAAGITFGKAPVIQQIAFTSSNLGTGLTQARIVYHPTYTGNRGYLEVYLNATAAATITVQMFGSLGWSLLAPNTAGSIPSGYSNKAITFAADSMVADKFIGNASSATKLANAKTISLSGQVTGSATFDGTSNATINATLANSGVEAGSYGPSSNATPGHNATFNVPYITVDAQGRVTSAATRTITLPADTNTDTKVTNTLATTTKAYVTGTTSATTNTGTQVFDTGVYLDTTAGKLVANTFQGSLSGNASSASSATKATQDSAGQQINTTYIKGLSVSGKVITYTKGDGTTGTITTQDTNTTYSAGTSTVLGLTKLYTGIGTATDGTMTQAAINSALDGKANSSHGTHVTYGGNGSASTVSRSDHTHSYLPLSGGTVTGETVFSQGTRIHSAEGAAGSTGYVNIAQISVVGNYANQPFTFTFTQRGNGTTSRVHIAFVATNTTDPNIANFNVEGPGDVYIQKSATSTWQLYIKKTEGYDRIDILDFNKGKYAAGLKVTWKDALVSSVPSGFITAETRAYHKHRLMDLHMIHVDGFPVGNSSDSPIGTIYCHNSARDHMTRLSCYYNADLKQDYTTIGLYNTADKTTKTYINLYPDHVKINKPVEIGSYRLTIATSAPSSPSTGDIWIDV